MGVEDFHCQGLRWEVYWLHTSLSAQFYQPPSHLASPGRSLKPLIANSVLRNLLYQTAAPNNIKSLRANQF